MIELGGSIATIFMLIYAMIVQPDHARCPRHMYLRDGVRTWGSYTCARPPRDGETETPDEPGEYRSRIYCTSGTQPIIVDFRTVGCQRRRSS